METKVIQNNLFFQEIASRIGQGERVLIRVKGNSMLPFVRDTIDEVVLQKPNQQSFQKGRLLLVQMADKHYLLHRVEKILNEQITLRGDGNLTIAETCTTNDVVAEATTVIRSGKAIQVASLKWNLYRYLWPSNPFLRRVGLAVYRRIRRVK